MTEVPYVHVRWPNGDHDMVPESTAHIRAEAGDFEILDATPARWRAFKPRWPLGVRHPGSNDTDGTVIEPFSAWKVDQLREEVALRNDAREDDDQIPDGTKAELVAALEADDAALNVTQELAAPAADETAPAGAPQAEEATE